MIKKLLTTAALCASFVATFAQNNDRILTPIANGEIKVGFPTAVAAPKNASNNTIASVAILDTLEYFFNKHIYRNLASAQFIGANVPFQFTTSPVSAVSSRFLNGSSITSTGAEAVVARKASSATNTLSIKLKLCTLVGGVPQLPGIDSLVASLTTTATGGYFLGGDWINGPHVIATDFAIVAMNNRPPGDTCTFYMTNGSVPSATAGSIPAGSKFGEGLSSLRTAGNWSTTTGYWGTANIPFATSSMEYCLSARVSYTASADHAAVATTVCPQTAVVYNNTSSSVITNRQFNFNKFAIVWMPFLSPIPSTDSVFTFNAGDGQGLFFDQNHVHFYNTIGIYTSTLTANIRKTNYANPVGASSIKAMDTKNNGIQTLLACGGTLGLANLNVVEGVSIYPNPSNTGLVNITNLSNECTIELVNMLGQTVSKEKVNTANYVADYSNLPTGSYFLKITSNNEKAKITKLILN